MVSRLIFGLKIENHICFGITFITRTSANIRKQEFMNTIKNLRASNLQKCHKTASLYVGSFHERRNVLDRLI